MICRKLHFVKIKERIKRSVLYIIMDYCKNIINIDKKNLQIVSKKDTLICGKKEEGK